MTIRSRVEDLIGAVERDEPIDWRRLDALITLEGVLLGETMLDEAIEREKQADARLERFIVGD